MVQNNHQVTVIGGSEKSKIMIISEIIPKPNWVLTIVAEDGRTGTFDVSPYLKYEAFEAVKDHSEFLKILNDGYFVEWDCGADLSADTIESRWQVIEKPTPEP